MPLMHALLLRRYADAHAMLIIDALHAATPCLRLRDACFAMPIFSLLLRCFTTRHAATLRCYC